MTDAALCWDDALSLSKKIRAGELTSLEVTKALIEAIKKFNEPLNAVVTLDEEGALARAAEADERIQSGALDDSPLAGVPYLAKDLDITAGIRTTFGSMMHSDYVPKWDMIHIARLKEAGCVLLGKANTPENGVLPNTYNDVFGITRNPWNTDLCPGGSSGGSAVSAAAGFAPLTTGSDAGGSIRIPASFCGVFGFKPTFGAIPFGPKGIPVSCSVSHLGPITRTVADAAAMFDVMAGGDERDWISIARGPSILDALDGPLALGKVAYSADLGYAEIEPEVRLLFDKAIDALRAAGWDLEEAHPGFDDPGAALNAITTFEWGSVDLMEANADPELFEAAIPEVKGLAERRREFTADDLWAGLQTRKNLCASMGAFFDTYDLLLTPTLTCTAFEAGRPFPPKKDQPDEYDYSFNSLLYPFNITGDPACSIPMGLTSESMPTGLQMVGPRHADLRVMQAAFAYESLGTQIDQRPPFSVG